MLPDKLQLKPLISESHFFARAVLVGKQINLGTVSKVTGAPEIGKLPLTVSVGEDGVAVLFRYGVVVLFNISDDTERMFLGSMKPSIKSWSEDVITENWSVSTNPDSDEGIEEDRVLLSIADIKRLQLVAAALSKSVILDEFEFMVKDSFEQIEPLAADLQHNGRAARDSKKLLKHIGNSLLSRHRMAGRVGIQDKPELLWNSHELDSLYLQLEDQLEISERHAILNRKLELIGATATTALELLNARRGLRLEWYIVILIVVEIVLIVYDLFLKP